MNLIPLDKSWTIRMGVLDILHGRNQIIKFLESQNKLSDDLQALLRAAKQWHTKKVDVGESGTLYRFLQFAAWELNKPVEFVKKGTLSTRQICHDPSIVNLPVHKLLELDNGTSQWASAKVLMGSTEQAETVPYKLKITYEAREHWHQRVKEGKDWEARQDKTIEAQARAFLGEDFVPGHSEDYCFARAFGLITCEEGERRWPSLRGHETDRIQEMERCLKEYAGGQKIQTNDHRVVQAIAMKAATEGKKAEFSNPECVSKSWPEFWDFLINST